MADPSSKRSGPDAGAGLGSEEALRLLTQLVAIAPTNLEDPLHGRWEKPHYGRASEAIVRAARSLGLSTRIYDPTVSGALEVDWHGAGRPNVIIDLDVGAKSTVLILAHYDVVPVPAEQLARWKSPPHTLTQRPDGRLYARGSNDDLGSGVVASLTALGRLVDAQDVPHNVRLLVCCDEETGGQGGIDAIRAHDDALPPDDPERILSADVALIPDGSPETTAGSSGIAFLEASFVREIPLSQALAAGGSLVDLNELARSWRSVYPSPDWPDRHAPEPVLTGRATVTQFDLGEAKIDPDRVGLLEAHAETDAANQVARAVTLLFGGPARPLDELRSKLVPLVRAPYRLEPVGASALDIPPGVRAVQVIGEATHGGYPHRGHNPVPETIRLLRLAAEQGHIDGRSMGVASFTVDLRLIPEMELEEALARVEERLGADPAVRASGMKVEAPPGRRRAGYAVAIDHPAVAKLARTLKATLGVSGIYGEYGGTDASALRGLATPGGASLPALVFGSMDPASHIHDAEESLDPRLFRGVVETIERYIREP